MECVGYESNIGLKKKESLLITVNLSASERRL